MSGGIGEVWIRHLLDGGYHHLPKENERAYPPNVQPLGVRHLQHWSDTAGKREFKSKGVPDVWHQCRGWPSGGMANLGVSISGQLSAQAPHELILDQNTNSLISGQSKKSSGSYHLSRPSYHNQKVEVMKTHTLVEMARIGEEASTPKGDVQQQNSLRPWFYNTLNGLQTALRFQVQLFTSCSHRMLANALGISSDLIGSCVPAGSLDKERISSKDLRMFLDMGYFTSALNFTYNLKNGLNNVKVLIKSLDLLERKILSFADVQEAKMAFSVYENLDQRGVTAETCTLMKVIKMCGFAISPQKLAMHLKQSRHSYTEEGRLQLYEFLDLLTLCEPRSNFIIKDDRVGHIDKTNRGTYQLNDMRSFMVTPDEKLARHLNWRFQHVDSWRLPKGTSKTKNDDRSNYQQSTSLNGTRPQLLRCRSMASVEEPTEESWTLLTPVPHLRCHCYTPKRIKPILSEGDLQDTQNNIEEVLYQMETLDERSRWDLNWKMDYYLPGPREHVPLRHKSAVTQAPLSITKKSRKVDVFERLSAPRRRFPSPCHAVTCDAFRLGIGNKAQTETQGHKTIAFPAEKHQHKLKGQLGQMDK
ncbi:uncharacterized protein RCH25_004522 [Pelodytes ibericus]